MAALIAAGTLAAVVAAPAATASAPSWCPSNPMILVACVGGSVAVDQADEVAATAVDKTVLQPLNTLGIKAIDTLLGVFVEIWLDLSSVDLNSQGAVTLYGTTLSIGWLIAAVLLMFQGIQTMAAGRATPLLQALRGLIVTGLVALVGVGVTGFLLEFSDALAKMILGDLTENGLLHKKLVSLILQEPSTRSAAGVAVTLVTFMLALLLILTMIVQLVVLLLRNATIPILTILLPIAAAGQVGGGATRQWLPKIITAVAAVITYKPMVALILVAAVRQERNSTSVSGMLYGLLMFVLSLIAMPMLLRAFAPLGLMVTSGSGGGGVLRMAADAALAAASVSSGGAAAATTAADHARNRERDSGGGGATSTPNTPSRVDPAGSPSPARPAQQSQQSPSRPPAASGQPAAPARGAPAEASQSEAKSTASTAASVTDTAPMAPLPSGPPPTSSAPAPSTAAEAGAASAAPSGAVPAPADPGASAGASAGASPMAGGAALIGAAATVQQQVSETVVPSTGPLAGEAAPAANSPTPGDGGARTPPTTGGLTIDDRS
ncbi:hypothetical protein ACFV1N_25195 [Streptosporangium canum]|uniref:hypothetical protein n=1 Tax=Streptosporangium canum TaxID=324952 RepID=UPI0036889E06